MIKYLEKIVAEALEKIGIKANLIIIDNNTQHADFASNIAMMEAKKNSMNPRELAEKIIENINKDRIKNIEVAGPGFINFFIKPKYLLQVFNEINDHKDEWGKGNQNQYINVEYVSANPTGFLHLGHARGAAIGSSLVDILRFAGNKVDSEYYINDYGVQINILGQAIFTRYLQAHGVDIEMPENTYKGDEIIEVAQMFTDKYKDKFVSSKYEDVADIFKGEGKLILLEIIKEHLGKFGVVIEKYYSEESLYLENKIEPTLDKIKDKYEKDGALWLNTTKYGDDKDRVLRKSDGTFTYFTPDIAYHNIKLSRGYDKIINIWGADHSGYIKRMKIAIEALGYRQDMLDVLCVQMVRLLRDGTEFKMSKRAGTSFWLKELLELAGKDATRYFMVNYSENTKIDFDIDVSTSKSSDNPVFYIQYAYARAHQVLNHPENNVKHTKVETLSSPEELALAKEIAKFPALIDLVARNYKIHLLTNYLLSLAKLFHSFYNSNKIIEASDKSEKLSLVKAVKQVLHTGLKLIGVSTPERMDR